MERKLDLIPIFVLVLLLSASLVVSGKGHKAPATPDGAADGGASDDKENPSSENSESKPAKETKGDGAGASSGAIDITTIGAKLGTDVAPALSKAWKQACESTEPSTIVVPKGNFSLGPNFEFKGPCKGPVTIEMSGNFEAPKTIAEFKKADTWVKFERIEHLTVIAKDGGGIFDGKGDDGWKNNKCAKAGTCGTLPYNFRLNFVNDSVFDGITSKDSKQFHMNLMGVSNLTIQNAKFIAPGDSPNTDGIHMGRSEGINILDTTIQTGDDCISVGDGTKNLTVKKVECGPGHGFSIGSLGRYDKEEPVTGVLVSNCTFKNTDNGVRIKSWLNSKDGAVSDVRFEDLTMDNVTNPILIDQAYCPAAKCDASVPSKVKINDISFKNIKGTASDPSVLRFVCSKGVPCENIHLEDIDLKYEDGKLGPAVSECCNVKPEVVGTVNPKACGEETTEAEAAEHITASTKFLKKNEKKA